jgi:hypothetical protein
MSRPKSACLLDSLGSIAGFARHLQLGIRLDERAQALPHHFVVVCDQDADRHCAWPPLDPVDRGATGACPPKGYTPIHHALDGVRATRRHTGQ